MRAGGGAWVSALADAGDRLVGLAAGCLFSVLLVFSGYCLWDSATVAYGALVTPQLRKAKPEPDSPTLAELQAQNPDVCGWLTLDGTHIDYPVVQGADDLEYVNKAADGSFALSGAVFLSAANRADFSDAYNLLYGHHMENGAMFSDLTRFSESEYFADHTTGTLYAEGTSYELQVFACVLTDAYDPVVYTPSTDPAALTGYIRAHAVQYRDPPENCRVAAFSTCDDSRTNGRVAVFAALKGGDTE